VGQKEYLKLRKGYLQQLANLGNLEVRHQQTYLPYEELKQDRHQSHPQEDQLPN
jgi:hypothetical protein